MYRCRCTVPHFSICTPPSTITATDADAAAAAATRHFSAITTPHGRRCIKSLYFPPSQPFAPAALHRPPGNGLSLHAYIIIIIICAFTIFYNIYNCPRVLGVLTKSSSSSGECTHENNIYMIYNIARNMRYMSVCCMLFIPSENILL